MISFTVLANDAVLPQVLHLLQRGKNTLLHVQLAFPSPVLVTIENRRKTREEQLDDQRGNVQVLRHGFGDIFNAVGEIELQQVAGISTQQGNFSPTQASADKQAVKRVTLCLAKPDARKGILKLFFYLLQVDVLARP